MKKTLLTLAGLTLAGGMQAQLYITGGRFDPTSVTNEGVAVGSADQNQPFFLWNTKLDTYTNIGGISAGDGIGGVPRFADSGKLLVGSMACDSIPVTTAWQKNTYSDFNYQYRAFHKVSDYMLYAVGRNEDGSKGVILKSGNNGVTWKDATDVGVNIEGGLECISSIGYSQILAGGHNGKLYASYGNYTWTEVDIHPEGDETKVKTYWAIDFINDPDGVSAQSGVVGLEAEDGTPYVWYTEDAGENWFVAEGVAGIPAHITHVGSTYYMATQNGHIQKSEDGGLSWTTLFTLDGGRFYRIRFADDLKGIALTDNVAYITRDGGTNWTKTQILPSISIGPMGDIAWNDAVWHGDTIMVAGPSRQFFRSTDDGANFDKVNIDLYANNNFGCVFYDRDVYNVMGSDGQFYRKSNIAYKVGYTAGLYNVDTGTWTPLQSSGYDNQDVCSAPWQISGDGQTVVGNAYFLYPQRNNIQCHGAAWTTNYTLFDLGSKFSDISRNSTALACNYDGSVMVGWQDIFGPRFGSIWTKGTDGTYSQRMLLFDSSLSENDIDYNNHEDCYANLVATCRSISPDGKWIGGDGNSVSALPGAWVWNAEEGFTQITSIDGGTAEVFNDGSKAIGWEGLGQNAWLWTKEDGITYLNQWAQEKGLINDDFVIMSAYDMSPNGRYITGYGAYSATDIRGYVLDLEAANTGINEKAASQIKAAVYPNPVVTELHVDLPYGSNELATSISLTDAQGRTVKQLTHCTQSNVINVAGMTPGVYVLDVQAAGQHKTFKILIKR